MRQRVSQEPSNMRKEKKHTHTHIVPLSIAMHCSLLEHGLSEHRHPLNPCESCSGEVERFAVEIAMRDRRESRPSRCDLTFRLSSSLVPKTKSKMETHQPKMENLFYIKSDSTP